MEEPNRDSERLVRGYEKCDAFLKEALDKAIKNQRLKLSDMAAFYLLNLLVMGFRIDPHGDDKWIGRMYIQASMSNEYKIVGDLCLLMSGIWWQSLRGKLVTSDYYISIGSKAYGDAENAVGGNIFSDIFGELADKFKGISEVFREATLIVYIPRSGVELSDTDIIKMWSRWAETNDPLLARVLRSVGINTNRITKQ